MGLSCPAVNSWTAGRLARLLQGILVAILITVPATSTAGGGPNPFDGASLGGLWYVPSIGCAVVLVVLLMAGRWRCIVGAVVIAGPFVAMLSLSDVGLLALVAFGPWMLLLVLLVALAVCSKRKRKSGSEATDPAIPWRLRNLRPQLRSAPSVRPASVPLNEQGKQESTAGSVAGEFIKRLFILAALWSLYAVILALLAMSGGAFPAPLVAFNLLLLCASVVWLLAALFHEPKGRKSDGNT
jgi:hypothetical protein